MFEILILVSAIFVYAAIKRLFYDRAKSKERKQMIEEFEKKHPGKSKSSITNK